MIDIFVTLPYFYYTTIIIFGLLMGSFLNVVIARLPKMLFLNFQAERTEILAETSSSSPEFNLIIPRSHCPQCEHILHWWENIPVISYLCLKGACRNCKTKISARYIAVEIITAISLFICAWRFGVTGQAIFAMLFTLLLIPLIFIDLEHQLLPDDITLPLLWLGLLLSTAGIFIYPTTAIIGAAFGYFILWAVYWLFKIITKKEGLGYGDFKLLAALGAWLGWQALPSVLFFAALVGTLFALSLRYMKKLAPGMPIAFGPFLAIAGWIYLLWGDKIILPYFRLF